MPNNSSARRDKKTKKKKAPKPLSKQGRSASSDSSSSSSSLAAEEATSMKTTASSRSSMDSSLSSSLTAAGKAGRNPPSSREMDSSSLLFLSSAAELKRNKPSGEGNEEDSASEHDHQSKSQVKPPTSSQEQNRHFAKLLTRSKSKEDLKEGPLQGQPGDKDSPSALSIPKQARNIVEVRTERDSAVEAIAWRVDPAATGALERQPSSADTQQGSSSVISSVSSNSSNMPLGFISLAANRANAADLIRGRGALRTLPAYAQTAGTAVSLLPSQNVAGSNPSLSTQASIDRFQSSLAAMRTQTQENIGRFQLEEISEGQQLILRNLRRDALEGPARAVPEVVTPVSANEGIGGTVAPSQRSLRETAARPANDSELLENIRTGAADTSSFQEPELLQSDMSTTETRVAWTQGRKEARARFKAEAQAAERGETLPPVTNPCLGTLVLHFQTFHNIS
jgi:hypothetical protein